MCDYSSYKFTKLSTYLDSYIKTYECLYISIKIEDKK